jgi:hypothetical protein
MTTWKQNIEFYTTTFDVLQAYGNIELKKLKSDSVLQNLSLHVLEKFHINLINVIAILPKVDTKPINFLSLGLILRGMVSDIINYRYLKQIYAIAGKSGFEIEANVLELDFILAYRKIFESEKLLAGGDKEKEKLMEETFRKNFAEFYDGNTLKSQKSYRTEAFWKTVHEYLAKRNLENTNINTEAGKLKIIDDKHIEQIKIVYTYLSQLQHFSGRAFNFYKVKEYSDFNPHFTLLILFIIITIIIDIVRDLVPDGPTIEHFTLIASKVASITHE